MDSTAGEQKFWKSLGTPVSVDLICERHKISESQRFEFETAIAEARRAYDFAFIPEDDSDRRVGGDGADSIWTRADYVTAGKLSLDLIQKLDLLLKLSNRRNRRNPDNPNLFDTLIRQWLPAVPSRIEPDTNYDTLGNQTSLSLRRLPRGPDLHGYLLHLQGALVQIERHCTLYSKRSIAHWGTTTYPLFIYGCILVLACEQELWARP